MLRRLIVLGLVVAAAAALGVVGVASRRPDGPRTLPAPARPAGNSEPTVAPLAWSAKRRGSLERRAAAGLAHVIYAKSPGGAVVSAARTATWRPQVERAAKAGGIDPDLLEAIVMLESAGRSD